MARRIVIVSFQSLSDKGGRGIGRIGYDMADYFSRKGIEVVYYVINKGPHTTPFPSESVSPLTRYLLFGLNWAYKKGWISNTKKRTMEERMFDHFLSMKKLSGDYLVATTPFLAKTLKKHKRNFKKTILIPANPSEPFIAGILKEEMNVYKLTNYSDPYTSEGRLNNFDQGIKYFDKVIAISEITRRSFDGVNVPVNKLPYVFIPSHMPALTSPVVKEGGKKIFLYVAHSVLLKGLHRLLEVWKQLHDEPVELWIVGSIEEGYKASFDMDFSKMDNVVYKGRPDNEALGNMFREASAVIIPSLIDNEPTTVIEALMYKRPVLVSAYCGYADLVRRFEPEAVFDIKDEQQTKKAIVDFCHNYSTITANFENAYSYIANKEFDTSVFYNGILEELNN